MRTIILIFGIFILGFSSCKQGGESSDNNQGTLAAEEVEKKLQEVLINAKDGETISLPAGTFHFKRSISLNDTKNVTIKGAGMKKTILSFKDQIDGAEGMLIKADGIVLEDFTLADSKGDGIKIQDAKNVTVRGVEVTWTGGALSTNGGYALYPVSCTNVLVEKCETSYASDAGVYVGQSTNIVVRNNFVHHNVTGIEIENSRVADVYDNKAENNTGGILIFDMPDLPQPNGYKINVRDNIMSNNNHENFAPKGTIVSILPPGTGMLIMAHKEIDVFNNTIENHKTAGIFMVSWLITKKPFKSENFDPFCSAIQIKNNKFVNNTGTPDTSTDFGKLVTGLFNGETRDIVFDGITNPKNADNPAAGFCIKDNGEITFANLNMHKGDQPQEVIKNMSSDLAAFDCALADLDISAHDAWLK